MSAQSPQRSTLTSASFNKANSASRRNRRIRSPAFTCFIPIKALTYCTVHREALSRWIPRLPRLTRLKSWWGEAVEGNGNLIRLHCTSFKELRFHKWYSSSFFSHFAMLDNTDILQEQGQVRSRSSSFSPGFTPPFPRIILHDRVQ